MKRIHVRLLHAERHRFGRERRTGGLLHANAAWQADRDREAAEP